MCKIHNRLRTTLSDRSVWLRERRAEMELEERLASETAWLAEQTEMVNSTQPGRDLATNSAALIVLQARAAQHSY